MHRVFGLGQIFWFDTARPAVLSLVSSVATSCVVDVFFTVEHDVEAINAISTAAEIITFFIVKLEITVIK